jgi:16S rRNA (guanine527-N7)-methyltransferase
LRVLDVGSGAGFPGIPVAILRPECLIDLAESHQRKAVFLREASRNLPNVRVLPQRAETLAKSYDWIVSRAVDPDQVLEVRQAADYALLIGVDDARRLGGRITPLPTGESRVLAMFHVKQDGT